MSGPSPARNCEHLNEKAPRRRRVVIGERDYPLIARHFLIRKGVRLMTRAADGAEMPATGPGRQAPEFLFPVMAWFLKRFLPACRSSRAALRLDRAAVLEDRSRGMSLKELASKHQVSKSSICKLLKEASKQGGLKPLQNRPPQVTDFTEADFVN